MMKCDMCYDRTSVGLRPMCATVCPSQALAYLPPEQVQRERRDQPVNLFRFGNEDVRTKVTMMAPAGADAVIVDVADYTWERENARRDIIEEAFMD
jgi:Fe-S-cluster-containing dehydrogenase component